MIDIMILFQQVLTLVFMVIPGVLLKKCKLAGEGLGVGLSNIVLYVAQPGMIILAFIQPFDAEVLRRSIAVAVLCFLFHAMFFGISLLLYRRAKVGIQKVLRFATVFTNAGYMGVPLIQALLGNDAAIYATFYVIFFNIFVWTVGCFIYTGDKKYISLKKAFLNPATISVAIGLVIFLTPLDAHMPLVITKSLGMLNALVAPLSMMIIGLRLADLDFKGFFKDPYLYEYLAVRMLALPVICFGILKLTALLGIYSDVIAFSVLFVCASTPGATATSMFAEKYGGDPYYAGKLVSISTILSVGTMPLVSLLMQFFPF